MGKKDKGKSKGKGKARDKGRKRDASRVASPVADELAPSPSPTPGAPDPGVGRPGTRGSIGARSPRTVEATELAARLASLGPILQRQLASADATQGLTRSRLSALALLVLGGPRTLGELASAERVRPPTMTRLVRAMEADELVTRERHPEDGRSIIIRATARGERRVDEARSRQLAPLASAIAELDPSERRQLEAAADLLARLLRRTSLEPPEPAA